MGIWIYKIIQPSSNRHTLSTMGTADVLKGNGVGLCPHPYFSVLGSCGVNEFHLLLVIGAQIFI